MFWSLGYNINDENKRQRARLQDALETELMDYSLDRYWNSINHDQLQGTPEQELVKKFIVDMVDSFRTAQDEIIQDTKMKL